MPEIEDFFIVEVDRLLDTWKLLYRLMLRMWATFLDEIKHLASKKAKQISTTICVEKRTYVGNTKEK